MTDWSELSLDDDETIIAVVADDEERRSPSDEEESEEEGEQPIIGVRQCDCIACLFEQECLRVCRLHGSPDCDGDCEE